MIKLDALELNNSMVWLERYSPTDTLASERRTLGGRLIRYSFKQSKGEPITLEATQDYGWLTKAQAVQLIAMAADPLAIYTLTFNAQEISVAFRHSQSPAVALQPLIPRTQDGDEDYFIGQLKFITV